MTAHSPSASDSHRRNPLLDPSPLPYGAPPFDQIRDEDFLPAFEAGLAEEQAEIDAIAANPEPATFENTLVALERAGDTLTRVTLAFAALTSAHTNPTLQDLQEQIAPRLAAQHDRIFMNATLFGRVAALHRGLLNLDLDAESARLVRYYHTRFVRAGALLSPSQQESLSAVNAEEAMLSARFTTLLLGAARESALVTASRDDLLGLTDDDLDAASLAAADRGFPGQWLVALSNTTQQPPLRQLRHRATRERLFRLSIGRAERGDAWDTRAVITRLGALRAKKAALLGTTSYAAWVLEDQMAGTPAAVRTFLDRLIPPAVANARREAADLEALLESHGQGQTLEPWDWDFLAEQVRRHRYDINDEALAPYFEVDRVVRDGVFYAATQLYGITFAPRHDLPVYHPDVQVVEVFDHDGQPLALLYLDLFARDSKNGGAWMDVFVGQSTLRGTRPVVCNVANFPKPAPGQPALIRLDDVRTLFHEFGHALHGMFAAQRYPSLSGTNVARDFVELPSQVNEHWALHPDVLPRYARHWKTGEPLPDDIAAAIRRAETFNQGYGLTEILSAAVLDLAWHTVAAETDEPDVAALEATALEPVATVSRVVPPRYRSSYFLHIWAHGYAAGYYAYLWAEMLDADAYAWFTEHGGLTRANGDHFRANILSRGNVDDYAGLYRAFRGRDPEIGPMLAGRGIDPTD